MTDLFWKLRDGEEGADDVILRTLVFSMTLTTSENFRMGHNLLKIVALYII